MKKNNILLVGILSLMSIATFAQGTVKVSIDKVQNESGKIYISMVNKTKEYKKGAIIVASTKNYEVTFENVPSGIYSIQVCQDVNGNGELDAVMGIPKEPFGFSENPTMLFGPPSFERTSFEVTDKIVKNVSITLKSLL